LAILNQPAGAGTELVMMLLENPSFHAQFEAARAELRAAGLSGQRVAGK
jgi:hypothetical protein